MSEQGGVDSEVLDGESLPVDPNAHLNFGLPAARCTALAGGGDRRRNPPLLPQSGDGASQAAGCKAEITAAYDLWRRFENLFERRAAAYALWRIGSDSVLVV